MGLNIVGICRFSLLGRGDWKGTSSKSDAELAEILDARAEMLFAPQRMEERFATFEHLTLKSIAAQRDKDFTFLVCASDRMPAEYRQRLDAITADIPQVAVRYYPATDVISAQNAFFKEQGIDQENCIQFRLDDDDCVFLRFIDRLRFFGEQLEAVNIFGITFSDLIYSSLNHPEGGVYHWHRDFFSAGAAIRHPTRSIYSFGHFAIPRRMPCVTVPYFMPLVTHRGNNDTRPIQTHPTARHQVVRLDAETLKKHIAAHLPFLDETGLKVAGLIPA